MMFFLECGNCEEPTKKIVGLEESVLRGEFISRPCYDCGKQECSIWQFKREEERKDADSKARVMEENQRNGVDMEAVNEMRRTQGLSVYEIARRLKVSVALVSSWMNLKKPMPPDRYQKLIAGPKKEGDAIT